MPKVIVCGGLAWAPTEAERVAHVGYFLKSFDPALDHAGITWTPMRADAKRFETLMDALAFHRRPATRTPVRDDGEPNRPLTAYSIMIEEA